MTMIIDKTYVISFANDYILWKCVFVELYDQFQPPFVYVWADCRYSTE